MPRIIVIGGYGAFGSLIAQRLARHKEIDITIAGRNQAKAEAVAEKLRNRAKTRAKVTHTRLDATACSAAEIQALDPAVIINASGPFQTQDYTLAKAAIEAKCHYLDLADDRAFVTGITKLDDAARKAGVVVISGASSVPGLSSAVVNKLGAGFKTIEALDIGISPGNAYNPGLATTTSILSYAGRPFKTLFNGKHQQVYGWHNLTRHRFPQIGHRLLSNVDVPDLDLFPKNLPNLKTIRFRAGLEVPVFHLGLSLMSKLVRLGVIRRLENWAAPLLAVKTALSFLGSDTGGMFVTVSGKDHAGAPKKATWHLIATGDHGPYVPTIASVILAKKLATGNTLQPGARPCFEEFKLEQFEAEIAGLEITLTTDWS